MDSCLRARDGNILLEKTPILERWTEYVGELFKDDIGETPEIA